MPSRGPARTPRIPLLRRCATPPLRRPAPPRAAPPPATPRSVVDGFAGAQDEMLAAGVREFTDIQVGPAAAGRAAWARTPAAGWVAGRPMRLLRPGGCAPRARRRRLAASPAAPGGPRSPGPRAPFLLAASPRAPALPLPAPHRPGPRGGAPAQVIPGGDRQADRLDVGPVHNWEARRALAVLDGKEYELPEGARPDRCCFDVLVFCWWSWCCVVTLPCLPSGR
jgi:hypothetical protein